MKIIEKIKKHLKDGTFLNLLKEKIEFNFINLFTKNKNSTISIIQCKNYNILKRKFKKILNEPLELKEKTKSNKVWILWLQGYENAPVLIKACFQSIKETMKGRDIIFLSNDNLKDYITFPKYIVDKYESGKISNAHYSDLIRIALLCEYGGLWIDSTVLCTSKDFSKFISNQNLFVYKQINLTNKDFQPIVSSNWLIYAESNNEICLLTKKMLYCYWKKYNYAIDYFIFHFFFAMATEKYPKIWNSVPTYSNIDPHLMQFELNKQFSEDRWNQLINISGFHKLNHHLEYDSDNTTYAKIVEKYYLQKGTNKNESKR